MTRPAAARRVVLATDLDGTFAHGSSAVREALARRLSEDAAGALIYVTGRTPAAARALAARTALPVPDVLIADVGTSVLRGLGPERVEAIEHALGRTWPGAEVVRERLAPVEDVELQDIEAPRRVSYWIEPVRRITPAGLAPDDDPFAARAPTDAALAAEAEALASEVVDRVKERLDGLDVDVIASANVFLDVLPRGVNKGSTLRRVLEWLDVDERDCVVAGDSLNDLALFEEGLRGIAVGNCEPALRRRIAQLPHVYQAKAHGVEGIREGLRHHGVYDDDPTTENDNGG